MIENNNTIENNPDICDKFLGLKFKYKDNVIRLENGNEIDIQNETDNGYCIDVGTYTEKNKTTNSLDFFMLFPWINKPFYHMYICLRGTKEIEIQFHENNVTNDVVTRRFPIKFISFPTNDVWFKIRKSIMRQVFRISGSKEITRKERIGILYFLKKYLRNYMNIQINDDDMKFIQPLMYYEDTAFHSLPDDLNGVTDVFKGKFLDLGFEYKEGLMTLSNGEKVKCTVQCIENGGISSFKLCEGCWIQKSKLNDNFVMSISCNNIDIYIQSEEEMIIKFSGKYEKKFKIKYTRMLNLFSIKNFQYRLTSFDISNMFNVYTTSSIFRFMAVYFAIDFKDNIDITDEKIKHPESLKLLNLNSILEKKINLKKVFVLIIMILCVLCICWLCFSNKSLKIQLQEAEMKLQKENLHIS